MSGKEKEVMFGPLNAGTSSLVRTQNIRLAK
jgi:hypothetical protein